MIISLAQYFAQEVCLRSSQQPKILLFLFCSKCHSATLLSKGTWRSQPRWRSWERAQHFSSPERALSTTVLQWDSLSAFDLLWEHHAELPCEACFPLCCLVYSQLFPSPVLTLQGEGRTTAPSGFAGPRETSRRDIRDFSVFPTLQVCRWNFNGRLLLTFGISNGVWHVSSCMCKELKSKEFVFAHYVFLYQAADQVWSPCGL